MSEANKMIARRFLEEIFTEGNLAAADELVHPDYQNRNPMAGQATGPEGVKQVFARFRTAFPDLDTRVLDLIAEGNKVVARVRVQGTHRGAYMGVPPTGKRIDFDPIDI